jgi:hypothetical protein
MERRGSEDATSAPRPFDPTAGLLSRGSRSTTEQGTGAGVKRGMHKVVVVVVILSATTHGVWAERQRRHAIRWQGIATNEELAVRQEAVVLRLRIDALERDLRLTKERARKLEGEILRRKCITGEAICCD